MTVLLRERERKGGPLPRKGNQAIGKRAKRRGSRGMGFVSSHAL